MGNVFQIQCGDALAGRCWDCIAGHWQYIYKLEDNLEALETTRDQLRDLRTDVMRLIVNQERPEMAQMDRVGGWLSRVDAAIVKINQLLSKAIQERQKLSIAGCCSKNCKSSYTFGRSVAKCLKTVIALMNEGDFKEVVMAEPANQLQANLEALRTAREELYALKEDVMQSVALEEGPEKMLLPQVRLWLSMAESTITEADELIPDGPPEIQKLSHGDISNYRFVGRVAKKLDDVAVVKAKGVFKELVRRIPAEPDYISQLQVDLRALESIMKELKALKEGAMMRITSEEGPQKKRKPQVQLWLSMLEAIVTGAEEMIRNGPQEIEKLRRKDPSSYEFVRKVAKVLEEAVALRDKGEFKEVVERVLPDPVAERNDKPTFGTETMLDDIWRWLTQDEQLGTVGIYGMGGVGKTTLLNQINNRFASTAHNFDVVIWVVVSKDLKPDKIQEDIWKKIGFFDETWAKKNPSEKAEDIFYRLSRKKFVLFLDDLWQKVDLRDIGVPLQKKHGSMIVFTTRFYKICRQMEAQKIMKVEPLNPRESWTLFQEKVGDIPPNIFPLAKDVVKECGGLPLALITIGHAMAGKDALQEWEHALEVLRSYASSLHGMEDEVFQDMEVEVFAILKFSYDSLHGDKVKSCFLYCSLFPEDFEILKDDLVHYWISENFCARNEGYAIIGSLVRVCLLEENGKYVKMHDVIRDMALWIACKYEKDKEKFFVQVGAQLTKFPAVEEWEGSKRVSLMANSFKSIREVPRCGDLSTLFLGHNSFLKEISSDFFQYMNSLMVLDLSGTCIMILTEGISKLTSLQYLNLRSTRIRRLPVGLKFLQKLKYLNLGHNEFLKFIPRGVISCLSSSLQILIMCPTGAFMYENSVSNLLGEGNTLIEELQCLENLNELSLTIESVSMLQLFSSTQTLLNCTRSLQLSRFFSQRSLGVSSLANFRNLETLYIFFTCDLEELIVDVMVGESSTHHHTISNSMVSAPVCFNSLREVNVSGNVHLRELTWVVLIPNLEILIVKFNEHMKEIVSAEKLSELQVGSENMNLFSKLQVLELCNLPELKCIYRNAVSFPLLNRIQVHECPELENIPEALQGCASLLLNKLDSYMYE